MNSDTRNLRVRLTQEQVEELKQRSTETGMSLSACLRMALSVGLEATR